MVWVDFGSSSQRPAVVGSLLLALLANFNDLSISLHQLLVFFYNLDLFYKLPDLVLRVKVAGFVH
jgi:hypothetical protein